MVCLSPFIFVYTNGNDILYKWQKTEDFTAVFDVAYVTDDKQTYDEAIQYSFAGFSHWRRMMLL